jgi:YbbR domain-containing protein
VGPFSPFRFNSANIGRLILSLIIAFAIWAFVTYERDPERTQTFTGLDIQGLDSLSPQFQIVESLPAATITVKGPQSIVQGMSSADVTVSADLSDIDEAGLYEVDVEVSAPDGLRSVDVDPETITIEVDSVVSRIFDITVIEPVNPPATLTSINVSSSQVTLIGVQQNVERVDRVEVRVILSGRTDSFSFSAQPIPISVDGEEMVDTIRVEPQSVQVSVEFEVRSRSVPIIVQCACPADNGGLEIRDLLTAIAIPSSVRIEGPETLLAQVNAIRTLPINIEALETSGFLPNGAELDTSDLPEGITLERQSIDVYVEIEQSIQAFANQRIEIANAPADTQVRITPDTVSFELQGPTDTLVGMNADPPLVIVDLNGLDHGTHMLSPRVVLPPDVRAVNLDPINVQVTIEPIPATPTPTPAPSPTPEPIDTSSQSLDVQAEIE